MNRLGGIILLVLIAIPLVNITVIDGWSLLTSEDLKKAFCGGVVLTTFVLLLLYIRKPTSTKSPKE